MTHASHPAGLHLRSALWATLLSLSALSFSAHAETQVRTSIFEYQSGSGLLSKVTSEPDSPNDCLQQSNTYDLFGNLIGTSKATCAGATGDAIISAAVARTSSTGYSADGRFAISSRNALNQGETRIYDPKTGALISLTGPNGLSTSWNYDSLNRKTRETRADGTYTTWTYALCTDAGAACPAPIAGAASVWVLSEQSYAANAAVNGPLGRSYFDALGRTLRSQTQGFDGAGAAPTLVQDTEYNARGLVARQSNRYVLGGTVVWTSYTYDALGRVTRQDQPDPDATGGNAVTTTSYTATSMLVTNSQGQTKQTFKNSLGQTTQVLDSNGSSIVYTFDAIGQLTQTNAAGSITTMGYNRRGNRISMLDPAMGAWDYHYNAFGELVSQTDSLGQTVTLAYDLLGRMTQRVEADLSSSWSYDTKFDGTACGKGVGKLCEATAANGYKRVHTYDNLGRQSAMSTVLDNPASPAVVLEAYDANTARVATKTWPDGYQARYQYSPLGYLQKVTGGGTNGFAQTVSYEVLAMNPQGQVTQYRQGNAVTTVKNFDATNNRLKSQTATLNGQALGNVLNQSFTYDSLDNLTARTDTNLGTQESFSYDSLNRLSLSTILGGAVSPPTTTQVMYDARGNITYKSDVGRYWYDAARPNRMTNVTLETAPGAQIALTGTRALSYAFDDLKAGARLVNGVSTGNGNLEYTVSHDTVNAVHTVRSEVYTSFNMPAQISYGNFITNTSSTADRTLSWVYGPEHQRIKEQVALSGNGTSSYFAGSTWYLNGEDSLGLSYEKEIRSNGTTEHKHYVSAGGQVFALYTSRTGSLNGLPTSSTSYLHQTLLGSVSVTTDETGVVTERLAYDPWGKRRQINGNPDKLDAIVGRSTDRGYTMHEHLDEVGIIHMNGRIYDPLIGRFMSADPYVQAPTNLKTFNRYSYVWNNPLKGYDPAGFEEMEESPPNFSMEAVEFLKLNGLKSPEAVVAKHPWIDM